MQNRIDKRFAQLRREKRKAFIAFITAGDPNLSTTKKLVLALEKTASVDIIELGVPFSDPMADGPVIQAASLRALKNKTNLKKILMLVRDIRRSSSIPIALMSYYNPIFHLGIEHFVSQAVKSGVDGVIIPDLPPEEAGQFLNLAKKNSLALIFFVSPTSTKERIKLVSKLSTGFIYYVSLTGTTGQTLILPEKLLNNIRLVKKYTHKPICVGFGISNSKQVKKIAKVCDGVIVGSAIVKQIEHNLAKKNIVENIVKFVKNLSCPLKA
ncbi:MAG: tryptophan synthase subunit alpha [Candidatus Omnitrophota bacterium]|nr:tryptophan synthase subunit alpha [Candidatus Omnitrophota bacterium]